MNEHPFERFVRALERRGSRVVRRGTDQVRATCPIHRDARPSLCVTRRGDRVLVHCFAGCRLGDLVTDLGLRMSDLFAGPRSGSSRREIVATYDYRDRTGLLVAQKVRFRPKGFGWRRPHPANRDAWRWGLAGVTPRLYRPSEQLANTETVFLTEGEKAVDLLWRLGLPSACPPAGAGKWSPEWSLDLWNAGCREIVILPDRDRAGEQHAQRVAETTFALQVDGPFTVKIVALPGLEFGQDAYDWLRGGRAPAELIELSNNVHSWTPGATERARVERRRMLTRERVRRHRERQRERQRRAARAA